MDPQAEELNEVIKKSSKVVYELLSSKGKAIFFPKKGILSQAAEAKGMKINATVGIALEEDGSPMRLKSIADNVKLDPKDAFPYATSFGKKELREEWKKLLYKKNPSLKGKEISLPVATNALTHGLSIVSYLFINPGEKIIISDLYWVNYNLIFKNAYRVKFDTFKTFKQGTFNIQGLKDRLNDGIGKKIVLLNFPNNPTGYTVTDKEVVEIVAIIKKAAEKGNKILVIMDDAYFGLVYKKGVYKQSIFSELADIHENVLAIKIDGVTKEDYVWGFRVGFITFGIKNGNREFYSALESKAAGAVRGNISNASHLGQSLILKAFTGPTYWDEKKEKYNLLKKRFETVVGVLKKNEKYLRYFEVLPFNSGYFMCVRLKKGLDGEKIRQQLLKKYNTGVIALGNILRLAFSSTPTDKIAKLFSNIYNACKDISS